MQAHDTSTDLFVHLVEAINKWRLHSALAADSQTLHQGKFWIAIHHTSSSAPSYNIALGSNDVTQAVNYAKAALCRYYWQQSALELRSAQQWCTHTGYIRIQSKSIKTVQPIN